MSRAALQSVWRCVCRRREGDDMLIVYATFVICFVLFAR
jgi:hypothetical protein